jgi:hypothetical protein
MVIAFEAAVPLFTHTYCLKTSNPFGAVNVVIPLMSPDAPSETLYVFELVEPVGTPGPKRES